MAGDVICFTSSDAELDIPVPSGLIQAAEIVVVDRSMAMAAPHAAGAAALVVKNLPGLCWQSLLV